MADRKISDLTPLTTPASGDFLPIVDISEAAAASKNKRITIEELFRGVPLGTAAAPSIAIEGDEDTGVFSPGANQLAVATNGTGRLFVDASGNVSIGTSSPQSILNLSSTGPVITLTRNNSADSGSGAINFASSDNTVRWQVGTNQAVGAGLEINRGAGTNNAVYIDTSNRVGIGTTGPNRKLEVSDPGVDNFIRVNTTGATKSGIEFASSGLAYSQLYFTNVSPYDLSLLQQYTTGSLILGTNSTEKARIDSSGRLLVGASADSGGALLQVNGDRIRVATAKTPASAADTGTAGEICWDADYIYVCTATNTWKRSAIATW
jgi:hypothetical protein